MPLDIDANQPNRNRVIGYKRRNALKHLHTIFKLAPTRIALAVEQFFSMKLVRLNQRPRAEKVKRYLT